MPQAVLSPHMAPVRCKVLQKFWSSDDSETPAGVLDMQDELDRLEGPKSTQISFKQYGAIRQRKQITKGVLSIKHSKMGVEKESAC